MRIIAIQDRGPAGIRIVVDEVLPNGDRFIDLFSNYSNRKREQTVASVQLIRQLLKERVEIAGWVLTCQRGSI